MTRIVAGTAKGRRLVVPPGGSTRPTSDRTREGLFSTLESLRPMAGARVLDLYAGSGALGLEALSRGAVAATFVECDERALRALRSNLAALGLPGATVLAEPVQRFLATAASTPAYDVVLADAPYAEDVTPTLAALAARVTSGAHAAVERSSRGRVVDWPTGWVPVKVRRYGESSVWYGRRA